MALSFDGVNQYFGYTNTTDKAPVKRLPLTISAWVYPFTTAQSQCPIGFGLSTNTRSPFFLNVQSSARWAMQSVRASDGAGVFAASANNSVVANQWQFVLGWADGNCTAGDACTVTSWAIARSVTSGSGYTNKDVVISKPVTSLPFAILGVGAEWDRFSIGALLRTTVGTYLGGYVAEAAAWDVVLTDDEIRSLGRGIKPNMIRPESLKAYIPGIRSAAEFAAGITFSAVNSPGPTGDHSRRFG